MPGYEVYFDPDTAIEEDLLCHHCKLVLKVPYQSFCGHRYCDSCVNHLKGTSGTFVCVVDGILVNKGEIFPDRFAERDLNARTVRCKNTPNGCAWCDILKHYDSHLQSCLFEHGVCPNVEKGCKASIGKETSLENHLKECDFRDAACTYCGQVFIFKNIKGHIQSDCPLAKVKCQLCKKDVVRSKLENHQSHDCEEATFNCPFSAIGCGATRPMKRQERKKHSENAMLVHMTYMLQFILNIRDHFTSESKEDQEIGFSDINQKIEELKSSFMTEIVGLKQTLETDHDLISRCNQNIKAKSIDYDDNLFESDVKEFSECYTEFRDTGILCKGGRTNPPPTPSSSVDKSRGACKDSFTVSSKPCENIPQSDTNKLQALQGLQNTQQNQAYVLNDLVSKIVDFEKKVREQQKAIDALHDRNAHLEQQLSALDNMFAQKNINMADLSDRVDIIEQTRYDGKLLFAIHDFTQKRKNAILGHVSSIYSPPFYTSRQGYRLRLRVYLNGDGMGKGSHISLYLVIEKGAYDALLPWPFSQKVTLTIIDQDKSNHVVDTFRPDPSSSSFHRPKRERNIASGCPLFMPLSYLETRGVAKDDVMFVKASIDLTGLQDF